MFAVCCALCGACCLSCLVFVVVCCWYSTIFPTKNMPETPPPGCPFPFPDAHGRLGSFLGEVKLVWDPSFRENSQKPTESWYLPKRKMREKNEGSTCKYLCRSSVKLNSSRGSVARFQLGERPKRTSPVTRRKEGHLCLVVVLAGNLLQQETKNQNWRSRSTPGWALPLLGFS